jgi:hypothetical protein
MAGAWAIIEDPIFQGMAVSLLFGAGVATLMAVIVIPLGCISLCREFYLIETASGERALCARYSEIEGVELPDQAALAATRTRPAGGTPTWLRFWSALVGFLFWLFEILGRLIAWMAQRRSRRQDPGPGSSPGSPDIPPGPGSGGSMGDLAPAAAPPSAGAAGRAGRTSAKSAAKVAPADSTTVKKPQTRRRTRKIVVEDQASDDG